MKTYYYFRFVRHLENVQITLFIFLHSRLTIFQRWHSRNITSMNLYRCFTGVHCWIVGKPVSCTLDADRPRKTGSRYNNTLNGIRKPKGYVTMSWNNCLNPLFSWRFSAKTALGGGVKIPPLPGQGLNNAHPGEVHHACASGPVVEYQLNVNMLYYLCHYTFLILSPTDDAE